MASVKRIDKESARPERRGEQKCPTKTLKTNDIGSENIANNGTHSADKGAQRSELSFLPLSVCPTRFPRAKQEVDGRS
jgi:hypothetical protein